MKYKPNKNYKNYFFIIGVVGIVIILSLNLIALYYLEKDSGNFFNDSWYSIWFPNYIVWFSFLIIGIVFGKSSKKNSRIFFK